MEKYSSAPNHNDVVQKAFKKTNIFPMIKRNLNTYTGEDIARAKICSGYNTNIQDEKN